MLAAIIENNKFKVVDDIKAPVLSDYKTGAIIKVTGCGLCGSDIVKMKTGMAKDGIVLGHEAVGEITEINSQTTFKIGDRVALGHHVPCFNCSYCNGENYSMCRHFKSTNIIPGGFAQYIYVSEEHLQNTVFKIKENISFEEASFTEPLGCCLRAVKRARIKENSKTLIIGLGSIGILMGQAVKAYNNDVYGCDLISERVLLSENLGFNKSFLLNDENTVLSEMKKISEVGFDTVFLTAGAASSLDFALKTARDGATIVVFSSIKNENGYKNNDIYYRELTVMGTYSSSPADLKESIKMIEDGKINIKGLYSIYSLNEINNALNDTLSNKIMKAYIQL